MKLRVSIAQFKKYCKEKMEMTQWIKIIKDRRTQPQIRLEQFVWMIMSMVSLRIQSFLELDQIGRLPQVRKYIGSSRKLVCSDTSCARIAEGISASSVCRANWMLYENMQKNEFDTMQLASGRKIRVGTVDASGFGKHFASVVTILGKVQIVLDAQVYKTRGKELPATDTAMNRVTQHLGKSWCDVMVADNLYKSQKFFRRCKENGFDAVVKIKETRLGIIQDAQGLFKLTTDDIEQDAGYDAERLCSYELKAVCVEMKGLEYPVKVVHVHEHYSKPKEGRPATEDFFVVTTRIDLSANECRELVHRRWEIENNVFKQLNQLMKSKTLHTHRPKALQIFLLLWEMGMNVLKAFIRELGASAFRKIYSQAKVTFLSKVNYLRSTLWYSLFKYG